MYSGDDYLPNILNDQFIYKFGNKLIDCTAQFNCVKNRDEDFQIAFGQHVRKLRDERGWSQEQLAAMSNIEVNQISRIENGRHAVNLHTIKSLATALGKYPDELLRFAFELKLNADFNIQHTKGKRPETTSSVIKLAETNFLNTPKSVAQVIAQCKKLYKVSLMDNSLAIVPPISVMLGQAFR